MIVRWLLATVHILALAIGFGAVVSRARGFSRARDQDDLGRIFVADNWWGVAALLWLGTGLLRAFGSFEKGAAYYLSHPLFHAKLGLFGLVFLLELVPMVILIKWRRAIAKGQSVDLNRCRQLSRISTIEACLVVAIVFLATALARGMWRGV